MKKVLPLYLILTQSLLLIYTCVKRTVSNSSSLYSLFYSFIYNSVMYTKEKAKIVAAVWGTEWIQFIVALEISARMI